MKKNLIKVAALLLALTTAPAVLADYDDAPEDDVLIVMIEMEKPATTPAPKMPIKPAWKYDWPDELIDELASIYWAETGANGPITSQEKLLITQLIWNRSKYGSPFPSDLTEVCKQRNEFNHGKISDRNREQARANLDRVRSQAEGSWQGIPTAMLTPIYMTREGGSGILTFQDDMWVTCYRVEG